MSFLSNVGNFVSGFGQGLWGAGALNAAGDTAAIGASSAGDAASFLLRGDARLPEQIFNEGFQPLGTSTDLGDYVANNTPSVFVGTTSDPAQAANFATNFGTR